jgi:hypothetical protein
VRARTLILAAATAALLSAGAVAQAAFTDSGSVEHATFASAAEFPPVVSKLPVVLGAPQVGLGLALTGGAFNVNPTTASYQWLRCDATGASCLTIAGATTSTYTPVTADATKTLRVDLTPVNGSTAGATVRSEPTGVVLALLSGPSLSTPLTTTTPTITGTAAVGQTLGSTTGTWVQALAVAQYKWLRCDATGAGCVAIAGATASTYTLTAADRGKRLMLALTANVLNLVAATANTDTTAVVA